MPVAAAVRLRRRAPEAPVTWSAGTGPDLLDLVGGRSGAEWVETLPEVLAFDAPAGRVTSAAAAATGLPEGIPVGAGTGDNMAAALGMGLRPGDVAVSLGTSGTAYSVSGLPANDASGAVAGFCDAAGGFLPLVCTLNATRVTDVVARWLGARPRPVRGGGAVGVLGLGRRGDGAVPRRGAHSQPARRHRVALWTGVLPPRRPTWLGPPTREWCAPCSRGSMPWLRWERRSGGRLHLVGGGARSPAYRQIAADCWGAPVRVPDAEEAVATGACVQAAQHVGLTLSGAAEAWGLGAGDDVEPAREADPGAARAAYRLAAAEAAAATAG